MTTDDVEQTFRLVCSQSYALQNDWQNPFQNQLYLITQTISNDFHILFLPHSLNQILIDSNYKVAMTWLALNKIEFRIVVFCLRSNYFSWQWINRLNKRWTAGAELFSPWLIVMFIFIVRSSSFNTLSSAFRLKAQ